MDSLDSFVTSCYRIMLNIKRIDHVTNAEIYKRTYQLPLSDKIKRRQLTWVIEEPVRKYALYQPSEQLGSSKQGRKQTSRYIADIINSSTHLTAQEIEEAAQQRDSWRKYVIACTPAGY